MNNQIFNISDFNSGDGMLTSVWGPSLWHTLHTISFNYPLKTTKQDKDNYYKFIISLEKVLPCRYCRENYSKNLKNTNFSKKVFNNRDSLSRFLYNLHEEVNKMLGKESGLSFEEVRSRYEHFRARCLEGDQSKKIIIKEKYAKENGCVDPLYGTKSKCVLQIVPKTSKVKSFRMSPKCRIKRLCQLELQNKRKTHPPKKKSKQKSTGKSKQRKRSKKRSRKNQKKKKVS